MHTWWLPASAPWWSHDPVREKPVAAIPGALHGRSGPPFTLMFAENPSV
jgi:hypothetical protein